MFEEATIDDIRSGYRTSSASAVGVIRAHLDRITAYDSKGPAPGTVILTNPKAPEDAASLGHGTERTYR